MTLSETLLVDTTAATPIIEINQVRLDGYGESSIHMNGFSATIEPGQLINSSLQRRHNPRDIAALILGLNQPQAGSVRYCGQDWLGTDYSRHFKMRSEIGRVFAGSAWIQSLTLRDNIRLAMSHHGLDPTEIETKVDHWTERLSGKRIASIRKALRKRPALVEPSALQTCQFIRALCNSPRFLILERPLRYVMKEINDHFHAAVEEMRAGGTAVLWFAGDHKHHGWEFRDPVSEWEIVNGSLTVSEGVTS